MGESYRRGTTGAHCRRTSCLPKDSDSAHFAASQVPRDHPQATQDQYTTGVATDKGQEGASQEGANLRAGAAIGRLRLKNLTNCIKGHVHRRSRRPVWPN